MPKLEYGIETPLSAKQVIGAATDFTERRLRLWPGIDPKVYEVREVTDRRAVVREGSAVMGGIWAVEKYDWSVPNEVTATVQESNTFRPGGVWRLRATELPGGGSKVDVLNHRRPFGTRGAVLGIMLRLMGRPTLRKALAKTMRIVEAETSTDH